MTLTPERLAMIRRLAREDPYFKGMLAALEPPATPGATSCANLAQRKDTP